MHKLNKSVQNERGVALLIAMFAMVFLVTLAMHVAYETQIEYAVANQSVKEVEAYYAAKAGVELSLFRILVYKKVIASMGEQINKNPELKHLVDQIWQMPFSWPPMMPDDMNQIDKDEIQNAVKESFFKAQYQVFIRGEGGKIDINDLGSKYKPLNEGVYRSLLLLFQQKLDSDEDFRNKYRDYRFDELINNIADWVDEDTQGRNGRDEASLYKQPTDSELRFPPNRPLKTLKELKMISGMTEEFYNIIAPRVTVYGIKGINPNTASEVVLRALDPMITEEVVAKILERRDNPAKGGPFIDDKDFLNFLESLRVPTGRLRDSEFPLYFDAEYNFVIESSGRSGNVRKEIIAVTYDIDGLTTRYKELMMKLEPSPTPTVPGPGGANPSPTPTPPPEQKTAKVPLGRPNVVYWQEN